jgi:hypothetical protein
MNEKAGKGISLCIKDPFEFIFLSIATLIEIPLTNALLFKYPIIAAIIDLGLMIYYAINFICFFIID